MSDRVFVDTNILVYCRDFAFPDKQATAWEWVERLWRERSGRLSVQVCNEYLVTVTAKLKPGLSPEKAWRDVQNYTAWNPVALDMGVLRRARETQVRYQLSWWDSLIVAAADQSECRLLLSEDLNSDQHYWGIRVVNPFSGTVAAVPE
ncbi:MAG: PIN domain-containing protein [Spirochaetales bacterium]